MEKFMIKAFFPKVKVVPSPFVKRIMGSSGIVILKLFVI
jgi:hypothetical protein